MGTDPAKSVLDRYCRAYEVANLYAVNGSPFPTGTRANSKLTIVANAWRVAERLVEGRGAPSPE
jgi:choline dehydrogenase-like flavoprotein